MATEFWVGKGKKSKIATRQMEKRRILMTISTDFCRDILGLTDIKEVLFVHNRRSSAEYAMDISLMIDCPSKPGLINRSNNTTYN